MLTDWIRRHSVWLSIALIALGSLRIVSTYQVFSHTSDEPAHIACGMEWLAKGRYRYEPQHPPLARVAAALGPYLDGGTDNGVPEMYGEGLSILYLNGGYDRTLALARLGILPFFWIAAAVVHLWTRRYFGQAAAPLAVLCFTLLPPVLAHAGLATTDMAVTAMIGASFLSALVWAEKPTLKHSLIFGGTTALAILSKFSALAFLPVALGSAFLWFIATQRPAISGLVQKARSCLLPLCTVMLSAFLIIWAGYRFSVGAVSFSSVPLPFPELYAGIQEVFTHNQTGHLAYLLGQIRTSGWWYFFLVALAVKTPLPFFALLPAGTFIAYRGAARGAVGIALSFSLGILLFSLASRINLGIRHILPVYLGFSVVAGAGAARLIELSAERRMAGWIAAALLLSFGINSALAHPDYLAYFNVLAGDAPENVLLDSDLDWGQDMNRLAQRLRQAGAQQLTFTPFVSDNLQLHGFPPTKPSDPLHPSPGWNAVSLTMLKKYRFTYWDRYPESIYWPNKVPPGERIGKGILLWYFPPDAPALSGR